MNWNDFKYKHIVDEISETDMESMINIMIHNYDVNLVYFTRADVFIEDHANDSNSILENIIKTAQNEIDEEGITMSLEEELSLISDEEIRQHRIEERKDSICYQIVWRISLEANKKRQNRIYLRHKKGDKIDFTKCEVYSSFFDKIKFLKDGGWGIADVDGIVIVKNHLATMPSQLPTFGQKNRRYGIIKDIDTGLYGVCDLNNFVEIIHCLYNEIEVVFYDKGHSNNCFYKVSENNVWGYYYEDGVRRYNTHNYNDYILKVKKNGKWGCYDDNCAFIVDCNYDIIKVNHGFVECCRDGKFFNSEIHNNKYETLYEGIRDLYDTDGNLLLGGFNNLEINHHMYLKFYFGTFLEEHYEHNYDVYMEEYDSTMDLLQYRINYDNAICLVLDNHFKTIVKINNEYRQFPFGNVFKSIQELKAFRSQDFLLFYGMVDLTAFPRFIYQKKRYEDKYIIPYCVENYTNYTNYGFIDLKVSKEQGCWEDIFVEDEEVDIYRIAEDGSLSWYFRVNDVLNYYGFLGFYVYRIGNRIGLFSYNGILGTLYTAITIDNNAHKYVAIEKFGKKEVIDNQRSIYCYIGFDRNRILEFYEVSEKGDLMIIKSDWTVFNPHNYRWFPFDFLAKYGLDEIGEDNLNNDNDDNYCEEDSSTEKYGGYNGYDDDTIDYGFDGFPEATWNVD